MAVINFVEPVGVKNKESQMVNVSLFASAVRPQIWESFLKSLEETSCSFEVVFSGYNTEEEVAPFIEKYPFFKYIHTARLKPSQNYEIARRNCTGETVVWVADDAEFKNDVIGKAYAFWKSKNNRKLILSIQTSESGLRNSKSHLMDMTMHTFFGGRKETPLMAPLGMINREYFEDLGGFDRRFLCGQQENLCVMMAYADGGTVEIFGDAETLIDLDHIGKCGDRQKFIDRPFGQGYPHDRKILESACTFTKDKVEIISFEPFVEENLYTKNQSFEGLWA